MEEQIIQQITARAHITEQQARDALNAVLDFVRQNVPAIAPYLGMLGGGSASAATPASGEQTASGGNLLGEAEGALGGLFGGGSSNQGK